MRVSGCAFGRNLLRAGYPICESIASVLPLVDEFVVVVGEGDDGTLQAIKNIGDPKIRVVESRWNPNVNTGGHVLTQQTNIALFNCTGQWAICLQADEMLHERDHERLRQCLLRHVDDDDVEGIACRRLTFYEDANTVVAAYPLGGDRVVRVVKPHRFALARGDSSGFSVYPKYKNRGRAIRVVDAGATIYHYGPWKEEAADEKRQMIGKLWSDKTRGIGDRDPYRQVPRRFVEHYDGDHPAVMKQRIRERGRQIDLDSPDWRIKLRPHERRVWLRTLLVRHVSDRFHRRRDHVLLKK